jgi:hypothetical protein
MWMALKEMVQDEIEPFIPLGILFQRGLWV